MIPNVAAGALDPPRPEANLRGFFSDWNQLVSFYVRTTWNEMSATHNGVPDLCGTRICSASVSFDECV